MPYSHASCARVAFQELGLDASPREIIKWVSKKYKEKIHVQTVYNTRSALLKAQMQSLPQTAESIAQVTKSTVAEIPDPKPKPATDDSINNTEDERIYAIVNEIKSVLRQKHEIDQKVEALTKEYGNRLIDLLAK